MSASVYERIYAVVARVPSGRVVTYGQVARHLGMPRAARTVGWAMRSCPDGLPWHRVVNGKGEISTRGTPTGVSIQRSLLEEEGVAFDANGRIDLSRYGWDEI